MNSKGGERKFDLEERTFKFSLQVIRLCKSIKVDQISKPIISQLIRSATSVGANYTEANNASSKKDFKNKIFICKKESQETKYWLKLLRESQYIDEKDFETLWQEAHELTLIFQKIVNTSNRV